MAMAVFQDREKDQRTFSTPQRGVNLNCADDFPNFPNEKTPPRSFSECPITPTPEVDVMMPPVPLPEEPATPVLDPDSKAPPLPVFE